MTTDHVCQTCEHCTWDTLPPAPGTKCMNPEVLGLERDVALEHGLSIQTAYRLCLGKHWRAAKFPE